MCEFNITVYRSKSWIAEQRLRTGRNIPESIQIPVDPARVSEQCRKVWLKLCDGKYGNLELIGYDKNGGLISSYCGWGKEHITVDLASPTPEQISSAIVAAVDRIREDIAKMSAEKMAAEKATTVAELLRLRSRVAELEAELAAELATRKKK